MSDKINDGGPAFPRNYDADGHNGLSLRDWFAGQALAGIMAFPGTLEGNSTKTPSSAAVTAYRYADAMIAARKGGAA